MNIQPQTLLRQARERYRREGLQNLAGDGLSFCKRFALEKVCRAGLYNSDDFIKFLIWWNSNRGRFDAVANPFKIVEVDLSDIEFVTGRKPYPGKFMWQDVGLIKGGNWDQSSERVNDLPKVRAILEHYKSGKPWEEVYVENEQASELDEWRNEVESLYESIRREGYLPQFELRDRPAKPKPLPGAGRSGIERFSPCNEVVVDIARNGEFLFVDGRHRVAIAEALGIDQIPVRVSARHTRWQEVRESIHAGRQTEEVNPSKHPDLQDVL